MLDFFRKKNGMVTVFVTFIMVPVLFVSGIMVDASRMRFYDTQAMMCADAYGESVLSEYDYFLKQLYGLFAVTQDAEALKQLEDFAEYIGYSFDPAGGDSVLTAFFPYKEANAKITRKWEQDSSLRNNIVLETQIADFMKYRVAENMADTFGWLEGVSSLQGLEKLQDVVEERDALTDKVSLIVKNIIDYFNYMDKLTWENYGKYVSLGETNSIPRELARDYQKFVEIANSDEYKNVSENKEEYETKKTCFLAFEDRYNYKFENGKDFKGNENALEEYKKAKDAYIYVTRYDSEKEAIEETLSGYNKYKYSLTNIMLSKNKAPLSSAERTIESFAFCAGEIEGQIKDVREKDLVKLNNDLDELGESNSKLKDAMKEEINKLEKLVELEGQFEGAYQDLVDNAHISEYAKENRENYERLTKALVELANSLRSFTPNVKPEGFFEIEEDISRMNEKIPIDEYETSHWTSWEAWNLSESAKKAKGFYNEYRKQFSNEGEESVVKKKDKVQSKTDEKNKEIEDAIKNEDDSIDSNSDLRNIPTNIYTSGELFGTTEKNKSAFDLFKEMKSWFDLKKMGLDMLDKVLVADYDAHMFTCRVTGLKKESEKEEGSEEPEISGKEQNNSGEVANNKNIQEYTLTDIPMSKDVNYLYKAELEYLLIGATRSADNIKQTRNRIIAVRMFANFASTYTIGELNQTIESIALAASSAAAASVILAPFSLAIQVLVSGALRFTVASIRSYADWEMLKQRKKVLLFYDTLEKMSEGTVIESFLGGVLEDVSGNEVVAGITEKNEEGLRLSYDDYLLIMLFLMNKDKVIGRTGDLILLNVNWADPQTRFNEDTKELAFKMSKAYTAVKSTCQVKVDFLLLPDSVIGAFGRADDADSIMQFIDPSDESIRKFGTETEQRIKNADGNYYGYSVIRGY